MSIRGSDLLSKNRFVNFVTVGDSPTHYELSNVESDREFGRSSMLSTPDIDSASLSMPLSTDSLTTPDSLVNDCSIDRHGS